MSAYDGSGEDLYTNSSSVNPSFATNARVEIEKRWTSTFKTKDCNYCIQRIACPGYTLSR